MSRLFSALCLLVFTQTALAQEPDSKTPPVGPPWTTDFFAARAQALATGKPIFLYSTKTY